MVTWARLSGMPPSAMPPSDDQIVESHTIFLFGELTGAARVLDAQGQVIADLGLDVRQNALAVVPSIHARTHAQANNTTNNDNTTTTNNNNNNNNNNNRPHR